MHTNFIFMAFYFITIFLWHFKHLGVDKNCYFVGFYLSLLNWTKICFCNILFNPLELNKTLIFKAFSLKPLLIKLIFVVSYLSILELAKLIIF